MTSSFTQWLLYAQTPHGLSGLWQIVLILLIGVVVIVTARTFW